MPLYLSAYYIELQMMMMWFKGLCLMCVSTQQMCYNLLLTRLFSFKTWNIIGLHCLISLADFYWDKSWVNFSPSELLDTSSFSVLPDQSMQLFSTDRSKLHWVGFSGQSLLESAFRYSSHSILGGYIVRGEALHDQHLCNVKIIWSIDGFKA